MHWIYRHLLLTILCMACFCAQTLAALVPLPDQALSSLSAQGLLESDKIVATSISGTPGVDSNLTFYRMGLNVDLAFNANINRMQLGCGGVNNGLIVGCDIDLSNVGFMGIGTSNQGCPVGSSGSSCPHGGDFILHRPYFELAIANDNSPQRQLAGFNFGAETATGLISVGQNYTSGTNLETGTTCNSASSSAAQCQSGVNMISGYLHPSLFGYIEGPLQALLSHSF